MEQQLPEGRTLTDKDIEALAVMLEKRLEKKFYHDLGKGIWGLVWKVLVGSLLLLAAHGANDKIIGWWK